MKKKIIILVLIMLSFLIPTAIKGIEVSDENLTILKNKPTYRSGFLLIAILVLQITIFLELEL